MEFLLLAMLVSYYMTRNTVQDLVWKARGEDPPSFRREQERIKRREARRPLTDKRAARMFWANAWADAWELAGERRERIYNKRRQSLQRKWDREDLDAAEDEAYERNTPPESAPEPVLDPVPQIEPETVPEPEMAPKPEVIPNEPEPMPEPVKNSEPDQPHNGPDNDPEPAPEPMSADPADTDGGAQIIQFADLKRHTTEETDMNHSGETTNLNAGLAYTQSMADTCREGVVSVETSLAGLTAGGVTGQTLDALTQAQEALTQAAALFESAHQALSLHLSVQEAYAANHDAGDKQFVTAD